MVFTDDFSTRISAELASGWDSSPFNSLIWTTKKRQQRKTVSEAREWPLNTSSCWSSPRCCCPNHEVWSRFDQRIFPNLWGVLYSEWLHFPTATDEQEFWEEGYPRYQQAALRKNEKRSEWSKQFTQGERRIIVRRRKGLCHSSNDLEWSI